MHKSGKSSKQDLVTPILFLPIFGFLVVPIGFIVWLLNEIARTFVKLFLWRKYGYKISLVADGCDAIWNYKTDGNTRTVTIAGVHSKNQLDVQKIANSFEKDILLHEQANGSRRYFPYEKLTKIMVTECGYTCWKYDENFNVKRHFRSMDADKLYTEEDITQILSTLAEDMDENKPQWEWILFPRYQDNKGEEKSFWINRFHHAYMDGMSALLMLSEHFSDNQPSLMLDPINFSIPTWKLIIYYMRAIIYGPYLLISKLFNKYKTYWIQLGQFPGEKKNYVSAPSVSMDTLKLIRENTGATIPIVVGTSLVAAMKKVLPENRIIKSLRFGEIAAILPYANKDPQNRFATFSYDVSTENIGDNTQDFCDAVGQIKRNRLAGMMGPEPLVTFWAFKYFGRFPAFLLPYVMDGAHNSLFLSNIPAFTNEWICFGNKIEEISPWPPMPNQTGITIASVSYNGKLKLTGVSDSSWLTQEELQKIFLVLPKVIEAIAANGYIPEELATEPSELKKFAEKVDEVEDNSCKTIGTEIPIAEEVRDESDVEEKEDEPLLSAAHETLESDDETSESEDDDDHEEENDNEQDADERETEHVNEDDSNESDEKNSDSSNALNSIDVSLDNDKELNLAETKKSNQSGNIKEAASHNNIPILIKETEPSIDA